RCRPAGSAQWNIGGPGSLERTSAVAVRDRSFQAQYRMDTHGRSSIQSANDLSLTLAGGADRGNGAAVERRRHFFLASGGERNGLLWQYGWEPVRNRVA